MSRFEDLTGQTFGRWTVVKHLRLNKQRKAIYLVRCECGTERDTLAQNLRGGTSQSCGCLRDERLAKRAYIPSPTMTVKEWKLATDRAQTEIAQLEKQLAAKKTCLGQLLELVA